jgi:predicted ATPase
MRQHLRALVLSPEVKQLFSKWDANNGWPKRLESITIKGLRGWSGQRIHFNFPIVAIVGENGSGKSTILQAAASVYRSNVKDRVLFASDFFPDTAWDKQEDVSVGFSFREGTETKPGSVRKPTNRWRGNPERPVREVVYSDLSRLQPVSTRVGYARIAKANAVETRAEPFSAPTIARLSNILGRTYSSAKNAVSSIDATRKVTVLTNDKTSYSAFHQGAGEMTIAEVVNWDIPNTSLLLIDEVETSLHPRAQRRLIRDLATLARQKEVQIILTTHSPYVLEELPARARIQVTEVNGQKTLLNGISPYFAMTKMDDAQHVQVDVYVEDNEAKIFVEEVLAQHRPMLSPTTLVSPCGPASVGRALGQMIYAKRFAKPTVVLLDADQDVSDGCNILPGSGQPPERFVFEKVREANFGNLPEMLKRDYASVSAAINSAMAIDDHHHWLAHVANELRVPADVVWRAMAAEWAETLATEEELTRIIHRRRAEGLAGVV